jgi:hypothetical protein
MSENRMPEQRGVEMSDATLAVFAGIEPADDPTVTVFVGGPGAVAGRAVGRLLAASPLPAAYVNGEDLVVVSGGLSGEDREGAVRNAIRHAQQSKLPIILDDDRTAADPGETLKEFKRAGFRTRLVVTTHREVETVLTVATRSLLRQVTADGSAVETPRPATWGEVVEVLSGVDPELVDQVAVLDGDGETAYEGPARRAAWDAVRRSVRAPMPGAQGVLWLGELRRVTDYVVNAGSAVSIEDRKRVVALYDVAERRVLPELPIDPESNSATAQRELLKHGRATIARLIARADQATTGPETPGPAKPTRGL